MGAVWQFFIDNQQVLSWLGGGAVVVAGGIWTVAKFFLKREKPKSVIAIGGVAAGRDISRSPVTIVPNAKSDEGPGA